MSGITDPSSRTVMVALVTASASITVALIGAATAYFTAKRDRRRQLYGEAYRAALAWKEMLYRVRRRATGSIAQHVLVDRFHDLQERIDYHEGWIGSESPWLRRSYVAFVQQVKTQTEPLILEAWGSIPQRVTDSSSALKHPALNKASSRFLFDVRCHLSIWQLPKLLVVMRNLW